MVSFNEYFSEREDWGIQVDLDQFEDEVIQLLEAKKTHPGKSVSKKKKSEVVKTARKGENVFGGGFDKVAKNASKRYGSKEAGKRVAAAIMWKKVAKTESTDDLLWIIEDDIDVILDSVNKRVNGNQLDEEKWLGGAINPKHKGYCTPMSKKTCTPHRKALAKRFKHGDLHKD